MPEQPTNGKHAQVEQDIPETAAAKRDAAFVPLSDLAPLALEASIRAETERIKAQLKDKRGRRYWRSLNELAGTPEFKRYLQREFPHQAPSEMAPLDRRDFVRLMGATMALAGVGGCAYQPAEQIIPYHENPELMVAGSPLYYATSFVHHGYAKGVLGETHQARPIKLEGNPEHPAMLGATDIFTQASLLTLYDPDRAQAVRRFGNTSTWDAFMQEFQSKINGLAAKKGAGLRILVGTVTSPTLVWQLRRIQQLLPEARIHHHDPAGRQNLLAGVRQVFGQDANVVYNVKSARRILSLDSDFLVDEPGSIRYAADFAAGRRVIKPHVSGTDAKPAEPEAAHGEEGAHAGETEHATSAHDEHGASSGKEVAHGPASMNRLYVIESGISVTGANADHRLPVKPSGVAALAQAIAAQLGVEGVSAGAVPEGVPAEWVSTVVKDLQENRGASLVIAGKAQPPAVHALALAMNAVLGNVGSTVTLTDPVEIYFDNPQTSLKSLATALNDAKVELLLIAGGNPAYSAPADLNFAEAIRKAGTRVHLGMHDDETGVLCDWQIPESHFLESWGDARAYDGTVSIVQPLITPLYSSHTLHEVLNLIISDQDRPGLEVVRGYWQSASGGKISEARWHNALVSGVIKGTAAALRSLAPRAGAAAGLAIPAAGALEIVFRPDATLDDGSFANNPWLQELPKPISQLTWDNAAYLSPQTAKALRVRKDELLELTFEGRKLKAPVLIVPGHPNDTISLSLGYGRTRAGKIGNGTGFNAYLLRGSSEASYGPVEVAATGQSYHVVSAQDHFSMEGRHFVRVGLIDEYNREPHNPPFAAGEGHGGHGEPPTLYNPELKGIQPGGIQTERWPSDRLPSKVEDDFAGGHKPKEHDAGVWEGEGYNGSAIPAWGMVIDLNACIGCNACTIACQAENNIATVGKDQVDMNREMHWIRVDNYFMGEDESLQTVFQPVPCMHCEKAPCEPVCPVEATSHSVEGLNEMTYNRCIGTRYCSNNCPYKVRRFNFLQFSDQHTPSIKMAFNPDVTVRSRGVMEKCTYCVQRITQGRIEAEKEERKIRDGDIVTACEQVCPTKAITFGDINDRLANSGRGSRVRQLKESSLNYGILEELGTFPRTSYMARIRNPHPALKHLVNTEEDYEFKP